MTTVHTAQSVGIVRSYRVEPEIAGGLGPESMIDRRTLPPTVHNLHFVFMDWKGGPIVESYPAYLTSDRLARAFADARIIGAVFAYAKVSVDPRFAAKHPTLAGHIGAWWWLTPPPRQPDSEVWIDDSNHLHFSERAVEILQAHRPQTCEVRVDPSWI